MATIAAPIVSNAQDLTSMVSDDAMSAFNAAGEGTADVDTGLEDAPETESFETPDAIGEEETPEVEQPAAEELPAEAAAADEKEAPKVETPAVEELPEGVVAGKNRKGEDGVFVSKDRWNNTIHANHKLVQAASEAIGEPLTLEALQERNQAYVSQQQLYHDLTSGVPESQAAVLGFMLDQMATARQRGEVGIDPSVPMAKAFYGTLKEKSPDAFATLRFEAARDLVSETFRYAAETGDKTLFASAQHLVRMLANHGEVKDVTAFRALAERMKLPFYTQAEMDGLARAKSDPVAQLRAENERLQQQLSGRSSSTQAEQFESWMTSAKEAKNVGIAEGAIKPALASVEAAWKQHPADYKRLVLDPLQREVNDVLVKDAGFQDTIGRLVAQARRATSPQVRETISGQIKQAYVNRAKLAVEAVKRPIIEFAAKTLKEQSASTHARRQAGQNSTAPKTVQSVQTNPVPADLGFKNNVFDPAVAVQQMSRLFGG